MMSPLFLKKPKGALVALYDALTPVSAIEGFAHKQELMNTEATATGKWRNYLRVCAFDID